jgi:hypothetical protein
VTSLPIFLAPGVFGAQILDVLTDLSAAGLVSDFGWLREEGGRVTPTPSVPVTVVRGGLAQQETLAGVRTGLTAADHPTLCVLLACRERSAWPSDAYQSAVRDFLDNPATVKPVRMLLALPGDELPPGARATFDGWHNMVVAPEDASGPTHGHESLADAVAIAAARHAAPVVAAVTGLWTALEHRPLDTLDLLPGEALRVVRSFYRQLDGAALDVQLQATLLDITQLPLPRDRLNQIVYFGKGDPAGREMAQRLWDKYQELLVSRPVPPPQRPKTVFLSAGTVLEMFFRFLLAALRNAPYAWQRAFLNSAGSAVARRVQDACLGTGSANTVVALGRTPDGRDPSWTEYDEACRDLAAATANGAQPTEYLAPSDFSDLWRDYASAALTLCDAEERPRSPQPIRVGDKRGVVRSVREVMPDPAAAFTDIPPTIIAELGVASLDPADVLGIEDFGTALRRLERDPISGADARRVSAALNNWVGRHRHSYGYTFGGLLAAQHARTLASVRDYLARLKTVADGNIGRPDERRQRRLARIAQGAFAVFGLAVLLGVILRLTHTVSLAVATLIVVLPGLVLLLVMAGVFVAGERQLFMLIHRYQEAADTVDADRLNLQTALRDVNRLSQAYRQYLSWTKVLGGFLTDPLGGPAAAAGVRRPPRWGLPRSTVVGSALPDTARLEEVAEHLRTSLFQVGWLSEPWRRVVESAGSRLGPAGREVQQEPERILALPGRGSDSALDLWAAGFDVADIAHAGAIDYWRESITQLTRSRDELRDQVLAQVEYHHNGVRRVVSVDEFRAGVGVVGGARGAFDPAIFADVAIAQRKADVHDSVEHTVETGLGWVAATTQFSDGVTIADLRLRADTLPEEPDDGDDVPIMAGI